MVGGQFVDLGYLNYVLYVLTAQSPRPLKGLLTNKKVEKLYPAQRKMTMPQWKEVIEI